MPPEIHVHPDPESLSLAAAQRWVALAGQACARRGAFHVALSGGSTPEALYAALARPEFAAQVDWRCVHIYFGDERSVPPTHPDSNYHMADLALLRHVPIPPDQVCPMDAQPDHIEQNARAYEQLLRTALPKDADGIPVFDLVLLGIGTDGHVASLFPHTSALQEQERLVTAVYVDKLQTWRMTITFPLVNRARHVMLLATGRGKAEVIRQALQDRPRDGKGPLPVQMFRPTGVVEWHLDAEAAALLAAEAI